MRPGLTQRLASQSRTILGLVALFSGIFAGAASAEPAHGIAMYGAPALSADFTHLPPSSRLQMSDGTTLTVDMENQPCHLPAPVIDEDAPGHGRAFKQAAKGRRGVTAWVEREGNLRVGDSVTLHIPAQRAWRGEGPTV